MTEQGTSSIDARIRWQVNEDGVGIARICRPEKRNALTRSMWRSLRDIFRAAGTSTEVRAVVLTGDGGHFCAGADIAEFPEVRSDAASGAAYDHLNDEAMLAVRDCPVPVIGALSGYAVGGGLSLALACDFRIADRGVRAGIPAGRLGLVYTILDCRILLERTSLTAAKQILFTGATFGAEEALALGLVTRLVDTGSLEAAIGMAQEIADNAPLSLTGNKAILNALADGSAQARRAELEALIARAFDSEDYAEGQRAFAERRAPRFVGG
jgi:enoyl-CoA hydratase/carnithine racemase